MPPLKPINMNIEFVSSLPKGAKLVKEAGQAWVCKIGKKEIPLSAEAQRALKSLRKAGITPERENFSIFSTEGILREDGSSLVGEFIGFSTVDSVQF